MIRKLLFFFSILTALGASAEMWVKLDGTNFPDANFRNYLLSKCKTSKTAYNANMYNTATKEINVDAFTEINLNFSNGTVNGVTVSYTKIASLEGIKLFRNLKTLTLPAITKTTTYALKSLDVSGMPYLEKINNGTTVPDFDNAGGGNAPTPKITIPLATVKAENCPKLKYVNLASYKNLKSVLLDGSKNIESLFVYGTGLESLDISGLEKLACQESVSSWIDYDFTATTGITNNFTAMKLARTFSLQGCRNLKSVTFGNIQLNYLDMDYCTELETIDISGLSKLIRFFADFGTSGAGPSYSVTKEPCSTHTYLFRSSGKLKNIVLGNYPNLSLFQVKGAQLEDIDISGILSVKTLDLSYNKLRHFDIRQFKNATDIDLGYNRIHQLDLPYNKSCTKMSVSDNCLTYQDQYGARKGLARTHPYQYIRVGKVRKYKLWDNPENAQYVETTDDTASQKYYYAIDGGHIGNPDADEVDWNGNPTGAKEDPCYFYFDNDYHDGMYFYRNPYTSDAYFIHGWYKVILCRSDAVDFDPRDRVFYLAGDFNNWQPTEKDRFVYDESDGRHYLRYDNTVVHGNFRVWDAKTVEEARLNFGGHAKDFSTYKGKDDHVLFTGGVEHKLGTHEATHYTTYHPTAPSTGFENPLIEMLALPGNEDNYITIRNGMTTGIAGVTDDDETDAPVEFYNMQGIRIDNPSEPGIYIRRQGTRSEKVVIR